MKISSMKIGQKMTVKAQSHDLLAEIKKLNDQYVNMSPGLLKFLHSKPTPLFSEKYYDALYHIIKK